MTENGWPTSPGRPIERQAAVLETILRAVAATETDLEVTSYIHFSLRDADTGRDTPFHRFGLMTDRYEAKPAFDVYRAIVDELAPDRS